MPQGAPLGRRTASVPAEKVLEQGPTDASWRSELFGSRILIIEDDYFLAFELRSEFVRHGAEIIGPFGELDLALDLANAARRVDAAVVDINLHGELSFPVVDALIKRDIPVAYWTGYDVDVLPYRQRHITRFTKPVSACAVAQGLARLLAEHRLEGGGPSE